MFETYYPEREERPQPTDQYSEVPLGVEAAWSPSRIPQTAIADSATRASPFTLIIVEKPNKARS
jgi:hypothetical protein